MATSTTPWSLQFVPNVSARDELNWPEATPFEGDFLFYDGAKWAPAPNTFEKIKDINSEVEPQLGDALIYDGDKYTPQPANTTSEISGTYGLGIGPNASAPATEQVVVSSSSAAFTAPSVDNSLYVDPKHIQKTSQQGDAYPLSYDHATGLVYSHQPVGWTATRSSTGLFKITHDPIPNLPAPATGWRVVSVTPLNSAVPCIATFVGDTDTSFYVQLNRISDGALSNGQGFFMMVTHRGAMLFSGYVFAGGGKAP